MAGTCEHVLAATQGGPVQANVSAARFPRTGGWPSVIPSPPPPSCFPRYHRSGYSSHWATTRTTPARPPCTTLHRPAPSWTSTWSRYHLSACNCDTPPRVGDKNHSALSLADDTTPGFLVRLVAPLCLAPFSSLRQPLRAPLFYKQYLLYHIRHHGRQLSAQGRKGADRR